jgi:hypothetical protein
MHAVIDPSQLARTAGRVWSEGRGNPAGWTIRTSVGTFDSDDWLTWRTADRAWTAELRRSRGGRHVYLALFHDATYVGRYDAAGWHAATLRSRVHQLRSTQLPLRLAA